VRTGEHRQVQRDALGARQIGRKKRRDRVDDPGGGDQAERAAVASSGTSSAIDCITGRPRLAPSAARTASSRRRASARSSSRLARLAQPMSSSASTAPRSTQSGL
jgi:hypothetical protein